MILGLHESRRGLLFRLLPLRARQKVVSLDRRLRSPTLQLFVRLERGQALLDRLRLFYPRLLLLDSRLECYELLFLVSLHDAVVHQFGVLVLLLDEPEVDHSLERDDLVHVVDPDLKILIPVELFHVDHLVSFALAEGHIPLVLERHVLPEVPFQQIRERVGDLELREDDPPQQNGAVDLHLLDRLEPMRLEYFIAKALDIDLQVLPHALDHDAGGNPRVVGLSVDVVFGIHVGRRSVQMQSPSRPSSIRKHNLNVQRRLAQDFALEREEGLDHIEFIVAIVFGSDDPGVDIHDADIPLDGFVVRFLQGARGDRPVFLQRLFILDIQ